MTINDQHRHLLNNLTVAVVKSKQYFDAAFERFKDGKDFEGNSLVNHPSEEDALSAYQYALNMLKGMQEHIDALEYFAIMYEHREEYTPRKYYYGDFTGLTIGVTAEELLFMSLIPGPSEDRDFLEKAFRDDAVDDYAIFDDDYTSQNMVLQRFTKTLVVKPLDFSASIYRDTTTGKTYRGFPDNKFTSILYDLLNSGYVTLERN